MTASYYGKNIEAKYGRLEPGAAGYKACGSHFVGPSSPIHLKCAQSLRPQLFLFRKWEKKGAVRDATGKHRGKARTLTEKGKALTRPPVILTQVACGSMLNPVE